MSLGLATEETNYRHAVEGFRLSVNMRAGNSIKVKGDGFQGGRWPVLDKNNWEEDALWCSGHRLSEAAKDERVREHVAPVDDYLIGKCSPAGT